MIIGYYVYFKWPNFLSLSLSLFEQSCGFSDGRDINIIIII